MEFYEFTIFTVSDRKHMRKTLKYEKKFCIDKIKSIDLDINTGTTMNEGKVKLIKMYERNINLLREIFLILEKTKSSNNTYEQHCC